LVPVVLAPSVGPALGCDGVGHAVAGYWTGSLSFQYSSLTKSVFRLLLLYQSS
jgi:hypothetical protein